MKNTVANYQTIIICITLGMFVIKNRLLFFFFKSKIKILRI